jgi:hypothetical protein
LLDRPGTGWHFFGEAEIPDDWVIEISEADAARVLRDRGAARSVEVLGWVEAAASEESRDNST